jgi:predicted regulator of Ras-like GTPase activity (Roadblock/LC7/MglB family)
VTAIEAEEVAESMRTSLSTLKDVVGVMGAFVCTPDGRLVSREIPSLFDDGTLAEAGSRLLRVREAFAAGGDEMDVGVIRFRDHRIYMKAVGSSLLMILAEGEVNMPALRMAANLVGRRISPAVAIVEAKPPPVRAPAAALEPAPAPRPSRAIGEAPPGMRRFRGRTVD